MFGRKSKALLQQLQDVTERMMELTRAVEDLKNTAGHNSRINIERLDIEQAFLDELVFRLESLDIEELSGSLNLGNNFSPKVEQRPDTEAEKSEQTTAAAPREANDESHNVAQTIGKLANGSQLKTTDRGYLMSL